MEKNSKNNIIHYWWSITLMALFIIVLISFILSERIVEAEKVMEYVSYASVILSITLSIFAIMYTYTSNVQIQEQFEKINNAANNITATSEKLTQTGDTLNNNLSTILDSLENLRTDMNVQFKSINNNMILKDIEITNNIKQTL
jgi:predicted PurR-regulated permease PerM